MQAAIRVVVVPVLSDNFAYLLIRGAEAVAIDPADAQAVIGAAERERVQIMGVLTTHHHLDHAGGNDDMRKALAGVRIYGGDSRIVATEPVVKDGQVIDLAGITIRVLAAPCHTTGHVLYHVPASGISAGHLFTGAPHRHSPVAPRCRSRRSH